MKTSLRLFPEGHDAIIYMKDVHTGNLQTCWLSAQMLDKWIQSPEKYPFVTDIGDYNVTIINCRRL
jgi:hypothetical protein